MPQRHGAFWIAAYSLEHSAERRAHNASGNHVAKEEEDGHEPIHRPAAGNIDGDKAQRYFRWRPAGDAVFPARSEEHTSELQSLMRTSSAVICLNKKKVHQQHTTKKYKH